MTAGVADIEAPTDIGFISALYLAAEKHGIKKIDKLFFAIGASFASIIYFNNIY